MEALSRISHSEAIWNLVHSASNQVYKIKQTESRKKGREEEEVAHFIALAPNIACNVTHASIYLVIPFSTIDPLFIRVLPFGSIFLRGKIIFLVPSISFKYQKVHCH